MDILQSMFPDVSQTTIQEVLASVNGDLSRAADWILSGRHLEETGPRHDKKPKNGDLMGFEDFNVVDKNPAQPLKPILIVRVSLKPSVN